MDLEDIPGLSEDLNAEVTALNSAFCSTVDDLDEPSMSVSDDLDEPSMCLSVDLDLSVEDKAEQADIDTFFGGEPCCTTGPDKSACWKYFGRENQWIWRREMLILLSWLS